MLDPWTMNTLLEGQEEKSKLAHWMSKAKQFVNKIFVSIKSNFKSKKVTGIKKAR